MWRIILFSALALVALVILAVKIRDLVAVIRDRRDRMRRAMTESCLLCDSTRIGALESGRYICLECGFHSDMARDPGKRDLIDQLMDVKNALASLEEAIGCFDDAPGAAVGLLADEGEDRHKEATLAMMQAMTLLVRFPEVRAGFQEIVETVFDEDGQPVVGAEGSPIVAMDTSGRAEIAASRDEVERLAYLCRVILDGLRARILSGA